MLRPRRRWSAVLLIVLALGLLAGCGDDGLREGSGEVDVDDGSSSDVSIDDARAPAGQADERLDCGNPLFWGSGFAIDASDHLVDTLPDAGANPDPRATADAALETEQPDLASRSDVTETTTGELTQYDYAVQGKTLAVITVAPSATGWVFAEGLICEAEAAIAATSMPPA